MALSFKKSECLHLNPAVMQGCSSLAIALVLVIGLSLYVRTYTKWLPNIFYNHLICPKLPKHNNWYTLPPHTFK